MMMEPETAAAPNEPLSLSDLSLRHLHAMQQLAAERILEAKAGFDEVQAEIDRRLGAMAKQCFEDAEKSHGTLKLTLQDGMLAKLEVSKKVEWDSAKLLAVAQTMPWDRVNNVFKIAFSVPETVYKGIAAIDGDLKAKIDGARTVKYGEPKISLQMEG